MTQSPLLKRLLSALFYGFVSILVVFVNKILLTNFRFPSFLFVGCGQMVATVVILYVARLFRIVSFPSFDSSVPRKIMPLPILYFFNLISGLGGTQMINLPMFTVLRRFSILMTMILEYVILGIDSSRAVRISVGLMILGSLIAAIYDLAFDALGYFFIIVNDFFTAALGVYTKQKLDAKDLGKYGLMYYNCLFMLPLALAVVFYTGDCDKAVKFILSDEMTTSVWCCFLISCICGFILNYSLVLCTHHNSALTTTCVGPIKNLFVTYAGMVSSGDYVFQWANFIGINVSVAGSILYTYVTFRTKSTANPYKPLSTVPPVVVDMSTKSSI
ncbi:unnamed protein product [Caenorhabditis auriculariae]|uniref:Sugar phosphate transporter domain-containing protein n=1 Tax=Caenorhabditis auriculariae TaxID=2777116 RepID=A0A8S1HR70_9PELO|nr:unnamed protein product [Caenorhabditis auriculariae]